MSLQAKLYSNIENQTSLKFHLFHLPVLTQGASLKSLKWEIRSVFSRKYKAGLHSWGKTDHPSLDLGCGLLVTQTVKNPPNNAGDVKRCEFDPWVRKIPWRREWLPIPVFVPRESHGQRSLAGYSPWGCKESDTTELLRTAEHRSTPVYLPRPNEVWKCTFT